MSSSPVSQMGSRRTPSVPAWAVVCLVVSGAAGLLYELVWSKELAYLLGSSLRSTAIVVAAFLGGLALGARVLGTPLARRGSPARRYAWLEVAVGLASFCVLPLLRAFDAPIGQLYRALGGESAAFAFARAGLVCALLVPPAMLMGATLPVLVARFERGALGAGLATLYAANTVGAVLGSLLGGFALLPKLGLAGTTLFAVGLNFLAAALAGLSTGDVAAAEAGAAPFAAAFPLPGLLPRRTRRSFAGLFACTGFVALALQVAWLRLYGLVLGSSVHSLSVVLGVYLAGLALGSALATRWISRMRGPAAFAILQFGLAASVAAGAHFYRGLPGAMLDLGQRAGPAWSALLVSELGLVLPVVLVPCVLLGALFPLGARLLQTDAAGPATGRAYALNTVGTIAGALLTGFGLLPAIGVQGVVLGAAGIAALLGLGALALTAPIRPRGNALFAAGALGVIAIGAALSTPRWDPVLMSLGTYRPLHAAGVLQPARGGAGETHAGAALDPARAAAAGQRALYYREGINASVLVATDAEGSRRWLRIGGKIDASTGDMLTQVLLGLVPAALARPGARTLIVGHGSGSTARAALAAGIGPTDIVELEPAVIEGSRLFHAAGEDPLDDRRVRVYLEDARARLAHGEGRYGLIISEPSNPWMAGVNNLFTEEFYRLVRRRLEPDGVFCQWIQLYELSPATFRSLLSAYLRVFPGSELFCVWKSNDLLLLSAPSDRSLSWDRLEGAVAERELRRARLAGAEQIAAFDVGPAAALVPWVAGAERNTDDRPFVEFRAPRDLVEVGREFGSHHPAVMGEFVQHVAPPARGPLAGWPRELVLRARAASMLEGADDAHAKAVFDELEAAGEPSLAAELAEARRGQLQRERFAVRLAEARGLARRGDAAGARVALEDVVAHGGAGPDDWVLLARVRRELGDVRGSGQAAARVLANTALGPTRVEALLLAGMAEQAAKRDSLAYARFREAQKLAPHDARGYSCEARMLFSARDLAGARAVAERGLRNVPGDMALTQMLEELSQTTRR